MKSAIFGKKISFRSRAYYQYLRVISSCYKIIPPFSFIGNLIGLIPIAKANRYKEAMKFVGKGTVCEIGSDGLSPLAQIRSGSITTDLEYVPGVMVLASASGLPFRDNSFNTVVALDVLEHLPRTIRDLAIREMVRVAKDRVVLSAPLEDGEEFTGRQFALRFDDWSIKKTGKSNPVTAEHLTNVEPSPDELRAHGFKIMPFCNAELRFDYQRIIWIFSSNQLLYSILFPIGALAGQIYYLFKAKKDNHPPWWGGICVLDKLSPENRMNK